MPVLDTTDASFEADVLVRSETVPVLIDLWAPWCGPCKTLGPIIETVVERSNGAVALSKVNVDENPRVSQTFQVQSIPAVFAIYQRQIVDRFIGALPERQVQEFVDKLIAATAPTEVDLLVEAGDEVSLRKALELDPGHSGAVTALAELLVSRIGGDGGETGPATDGASDEALSLLARIPETADTRRIAALARTGGGAGAAATASPAADPAAVAELEARLDALLGEVPGNDEARQQIVDVLETMDPEDPRRAHYRRALSAKLF